MHRSIVHGTMEKDLLGGKLIALLLCSPEIVKEYEACYNELTSVIASGMRAASVKCSAQLVLLWTTSLYGSALHQCSRLKIPANLIGGKESVIQYENLGMSEGLDPSTSAKMVSVWWRCCSDACKDA